MDLGELEKAILDGRIRLETTDTGTPLDLDWVPYVCCVEDPELAPSSGLSTAQPSSLTAASGTVTSTAGGAAATSLLSTTLAYESPQQIERILLRPLAPPAAGTQLRLVLEASALVDTYGNTPATGTDQTFAWPSAETVLSDATPPAVQAVRLRQGYLEIELDEEVDLTTAQTAVTVTPAGGSALALVWAGLGDGFTVRSDEVLPAGTFDLQIDTTLQDLAGTPLAAVYQQQFQAASAGADQELFEASDERLIPASSVGNVFGFQGLPKDPETGLIYVRNRYYDPELGRFITADPLGYVDGPSMYQFAGYSPVNFSDPLGLEGGWIIEREHRQLEEAGIDPYLWRRGNVDAVDSPAPRWWTETKNAARVLWNLVTDESSLVRKMCFPFCAPPKEAQEKLLATVRRYATVAPGSWWHESFPQAEALYETISPIAPSKLVDSAASQLPKEVQLAYVALKPLFGEAARMTLTVMPLGMVKGPRVARAAPLKNASGALEDAAAAARTQPHGAFSRIQFGRVQNQIEHAFRHTDAAGLVRADVRAAITRDLTQNAASLRSGMNVRTVQVNGIDLTVNAYRLPDGTINVGRITTPR